MDLILSHKAEILGLLLAVSECLSLSPSVKANGIFQFFVITAKKILG
jgi:hypothetical protein